MNNAIKPDAQPFDEIRIKIIPRFKESELSGDEWRISSIIEFMRKGDVIVTGGGQPDIETTCGMLYAELMKVRDDGHAMYAGNGWHCDQEGCAEEATIHYRIKQGYSNGVKNDLYNGALRHFCNKHSRRGDSALDDCDTNYELI